MTETKPLSSRGGTGREALEAGWKKGMLDAANTCALFSQTVYAVTEIQALANDPNVAKRNTAALASTGRENVSVAAAAVPRPSRKRNPRTASIVTQREAKRYRAALEQIASATQGRSPLAIAKQHLAVAREALEPGYLKQEAKS